MRKRVRETLLEVELIGRGRLGKYLIHSAVLRQSHGPIA